jgi:hypothetical protein
MFDRSLANATVVAPARQRLMVLYMDPRKQIHIVRFWADEYREALRHVGMMASTDGVEFDWHDASHMTAQIRHLVAVAGGGL